MKIVIKKVMHDKSEIAMKITEKMLLAGYIGICKDSITAISEIDGREIRWSYRKPQDGQYRVVTEDRDEAADIMLEYDRVGDIPLDNDLSPKLIAVAQKHAGNCRADIIAKTKEAIAQATK